MDRLTRRYTVSTSDILEGGQKVYIRNEAGNVEWCKVCELELDCKQLTGQTRTLSHHEIVDELGEYSIHRPTRGWYIHVRASSLTMPLLPNPLSDADSELAIQLPVLSRKGKQRATLADQDEYSYPPPAIHNDPPCTIPISLVFAPVPAPAVKPTFSRAYASGLLRIVTNTLFSPPQRSFVLLSRTHLPLASPPTPLLEAGSSTGLPVLTYTDTTPVFSVSQMTGTLDIDMRALAILAGNDPDESTAKDIDVGLLVAAAMAYLDFLGDREGYLAAANGG